MYDDDFDDEHLSSGDNIPLRERIRGGRHLPSGAGAPRGSVSSRSRSGDRVGGFRAGRGGRGEYPPVSPAVSAISETLVLTQSIISDAINAEEARDDFARLYALQIKLTERLARRLQLDSENPDHKSSVAKLSVVVAQILAVNKAKSEKDLVGMIESLAEETMDLRRALASGVDESESPSLSVKARVVVLGAASSVRHEIESYPLYRDLDEAFVKTIKLIISTAKDMAKNWRGDLSPIDRQHLFTEIVPIVADIATRSWRRACKNRLAIVKGSIENQYRNIEIEFSTKLEKHSVLKGHSRHVLKGVVDKIRHLVDETIAKHTNLEAEIIARLRQTAIINVKILANSALDKAIELFESEHSLNDEIGGDTFLEMALENLESKVEEVGLVPRVEWHGYENIFSGMASTLWGAAESLIKTRKY